MSQIDPSQEGLFKAHEAAWSAAPIGDAAMLPSLEAYGSISFLIYIVPLTAKKSKKASKLSSLL